VYPLAALANVFRSVKITPVMQFVMFFSGLRGAIAFALAVNLAGQTPFAAVLVTTTLAVVLITIVLFGGGTFPLLRLMDRWGFTTGRSHPGGRRKRVTLISQSRADGGAAAAADFRGPSAEDDGSDGEPGRWGWFQRFDNRWLKRIFRTQATREMYRAAQHELRSVMTGWPTEARDSCEAEGLVAVSSETSIASGAPAERAGGSRADKLDAEALESDHDDEDDIVVDLSMHATRRVLGRA
jgi:sodium/hydrogen exchanger 8